MADGIPDDVLECLTRVGISNRAFREALKPYLPPKYFLCDSAVAKLKLIFYRHMKARLEGMCQSHPLGARLSDKVADNTRRSTRLDVELVHMSESRGVIMPQIGSSVEERDSGHGS